jgi:iron complex outermembrane receptor protein
VSAQVIPDLTATLSYTYSDFTFDRFVSSAGQVFDGKRLPGIPRHQVFAELAYRHPAGLYAIWDILGVGGLYADNANATRIEGYQVSTLRVGHEWQAGSWHVSPFVGVNNLFDEAYNGNVRVNAFGARYFEPAPDLNVFGGFTIRHSWE